MLFEFKWLFTSRAFAIGYAVYIHIGTMYISTIVIEYSMVYCFDGVMFALNKDKCRAGA